MTTRLPDFAPSLRLLGHVRLPAQNRLVPPLTLLRLQIQGNLPRLPVRNAIRTLQDERLLRWGVTRRPLFGALGLGGAWRGRCKYL